MPSRSNIYGSTHPRFGSEGVVEIEESLRGIIAILVPPG